MCGQYSRALQTSSVKNKVINIFSIVEYTVSVTTLQKQHRQYVKEQVWLYSDKTLFTHTSNGPDLAVSSIQYMQILALEQQPFN